MNESVPVIPEDKPDYKQQAENISRAAELERIIREMKIVAII